jgi:hypothetical protein
MRSIIEKFGVDDDIVKIMVTNGKSITAAMPNNSGL